MFRTRVLKATREVRRARITSRERADRVRRATRELKSEITIRELGGAKE